MMTRLPVRLRFANAQFLSAFVITTIANRWTCQISEWSPQHRLHRGQSVILELEQGTAAGTVVWFPDPPAPRTLLVIELKTPREKRN